MLGIVVVAYLIGNVATISSNLDVLATEFQQEKMFALSYCRNRNLPEDVVARVRSFYDQLWVTYGGVDPEEALSNLPRPLRSEILNCIAKRVVCTHSLFSEAPADFVQSLITKLKLQVFPLGEYIFRRGQVGDSMYFILVGEVGLYLPAAPRPAPRKRSLLRRNDVVPLGTESASAAKYVAAPVTATAPHEWEPRPPVALDRRAQCESVQPQQIGGAPFRVNLPGQPEVGDPAEPTSQGSATGQQQADAKDSSEPPSPGGSATSPARRSGIGLRTGVELKLMARRARKSSSSIQPMLFGAPLAQGLDELKSEEAFVVIGRGSFFGEGAMLTGIRNASARALSACQVLALNRQDFDTVFQPQPELLQALTQLSLRRFAGMRKVAEANMKRARELQAGK
jgi:CRP-like cAMP-binding protein